MPTNTPDPTFTPTQLRQIIADHNMDVSEDGITPGTGLYAEWWEVCAQIQEAVNRIHASAAEQKDMIAVAHEAQLELVRLTNALSDAANRIPADARF